MEGNRGHEMGLTAELGKNNYCVSLQTVNHSAFLQDEFEAGVRN